MTCAKIEPGLINYHIKVHRMRHSRWKRLDSAFTIWHTTFRLFLEAIPPYLGLNLIRRIEKTRVTSIAQFLLHGNTVQPESYTTQKKYSSLCILIIMIIMSGEANSARIAELTTTEFR